MYPPMHNYLKPNAAIIQHRTAKNNHIFFAFRLIAEAFHMTGQHLRRTGNILGILCYKLTVF